MICHVYPNGVNASGDDDDVTLMGSAGLETQLRVSPCGPCYIILASINLSDDAYRPYVRIAMVTADISHPT